MLNFFSRYSKCHPYGSCCEAEEEVITLPSSTEKTETHSLLAAPEDLVIDQVPLVAKPEGTPRNKEMMEVTNSFSRGIEQGTALGRQLSEARRQKILRGNNTS